MTNKLAIPPRPDILVEIQQMLNDDNLDLGKLSKLIKQDVSLYAILLSAVNSPWLGLGQPVDCIEKAVTLLGLSKVVNLLQAILVRSSFPDSPLLESFWTTATEVASIADNLAKRYGVINAEHAYTAGMLHNTGMAVMLDNHEGFCDFMKEHKHRPSDELCVLQRRQFETDHFLQGALLAKNWFMPAEVSLAIRYQPIAKAVLEGKKELPVAVSSLLAVLTLAKCISNEYHNYWNIGCNDFHATAMEAALNYLDIQVTEFNELKEDLIDELLADAEAVA
jgi:HD-like signal output (HDOD) protein